MVVLMATYNGMSWIDEQIDSILGQRDVEVRLWISDDASHDGTVEHVRARARSDTRITVLPPRTGPRGVTANFLYLFTSWHPTDDVFVALSDQDDIWHLDKLARQIRLIDAHQADAVSSDVVSFDAYGRRRNIVKSQPQVRWDHIFEAAGPGSTYLFAPSTHRELVRYLGMLDTVGVGVHDWFLYALVRGTGGTWYIDPTSTLDYRQHGKNVQGAHSGLRAFLSRLALLRSGFYRSQFLLTAQAVQEVEGKTVNRSRSKELQHLIECLKDTGVHGRVGIWRMRHELRRDQTDGLKLALACVAGLW